MTSATLVAARLTPEAERRIRRTSTAFVVFVAIAAAVLSFSGLHKLALAADFHPYIAWLFPIATDVAVAAFSLRVLHHSLAGLRSWYAWLCTMLGVAVSVAGNVWAAPDDLVSRLVHAWPPLVFALSFEALTRLTRHRIAATQHEDHSPAATSLPEPPASVPAPAAPPAAAPLEAPVEVIDLARSLPEPPTAPQAADLSPSDLHSTRPLLIVSSLVDPELTEESAPEEPPTGVTSPQTTPTSTPAGGRHRAEPAVAPPPATRTSPQGAAGTRPLTLRQRIVALLEENPGLSQAEIARLLDADPSGVSKNCRRLRTERPELFERPPVSASG